MNVRIYLWLRKVNDCSKLNEIKRSGEWARSRQGEK